MTATCGLFTSTGPLQHGQVPINRMPVAGVAVSDCAPGGTEGVPAAGVPGFPGFKVGVPAGGVVVFAGFTDCVPAVGVAASEDIGRAIGPLGVEGNGREGNGREGNGPAVDPAAAGDGNGRWVGAAVGATPLSVGAREGTVLSSSVGGGTAIRLDESSVGGDAALILLGPPSSAHR